MTVALSGDGGDEFFAGYNRHVWLPKLNRGVSAVPVPLRRWLSRFLKLSFVRRVVALFAQLGLVKVRTLSVKLDKLVDLLETRGLHGMYRDVLSDWKQPSRQVVGAAIDVVNEFRNVPEGLSVLERRCRADARFYLPEDILYKVDRASMYHSLEARSPFLDHKLVEFSLSLPDRLKLDKSGGKRLPRALLSSFLPSELFERPKMGFAVPLADWLRGPLKEWAEELLNGGVCLSGEFIRWHTVEPVWREHLSGRCDHSSRMWNILIAIAWLEDRR